MTGGHLTDFQESLQAAVMPKKSKRPRRSSSAAFKQAAIDLVVNQRYSFKAAVDAVGVAVKSLRDWHAKLAREPEPCSDDASPLVSSALRNAVELRKPDTNGHSDRGSQYTSDDYQQALMTLNMTCSMSRPSRASRGMLLRQRCHGTFLLVAQA